MGAKMRVEFESVEVNVVTYTDGPQVIREDINVACLEAGKVPDFETQFRWQFSETSERYGFRFFRRLLLI